MEIYRELAKEYKKRIGKPDAVVSGQYTNFGGLETIYFTNEGKDGMQLSNGIWEETDFDCRRDKGCEPQEQES